MTIFALLGMGKGQFEEKTTTTQAFLFVVSSIMQEVLRITVCSTGVIIGYDVVVVGRLVWCCFLAFARSAVDASPKNLNNDTVISLQLLVLRMRRPSIGIQSVRV
jgi:hypothetical protein